MRMARHPFILSREFLSPCVYCDEYPDHANHKEPHRFTYAECVAEIQEYNKRMIDERAKQRNLRAI